MAEGIREMTLNELIRRLGCKERQGAAPTAKKLRESGEVMIETEECTVYSNGYAVYRNETGRTVVFLGDCSSYTYHFNPLTDSERRGQRQSETVDSFGDMPWILAVTVRGDHQIEQNSMNCAGRYSAPADDDAEADGSSDGIYRGAYHFPGPEEAYIRKEAIDERLQQLTRRQKQLYIMTELYGYTQREAAEKLHIDAAYVSRQVSVAKEGQFQKNKIFFCDWSIFGPSSPLLSVGTCFSDFRTAGRSGPDASSEAEGHIKEDNRKTEREER